MNGKILIIAAVLAIVVVGGWWWLSQNVGVAVTPKVSTTPKSAFEITIQNSAFSPSMLTVKPGEKVTVTNMDAASHSVTADNGTAFDTNLLGQGESKDITAPSAPGSYAFHCVAHPSMQGTLVVQ